MNSSATKPSSKQFLQASESDSDDLSSGASSVEHSDAPSDVDAEALKKSDEESRLAQKGSKPRKKQSPSSKRSSPPASTSSQEFTWKTFVAAISCLVVAGLVVFVGYELWDVVDPGRRWALGWFLVSTPVCLWDSGYQIFRPRSFSGGDLHWIWKPYGIYQKVDYMYGPPKYKSKDGLPLSIGTMDVVESIINFLVLCFAWNQQEALMLLVGFMVATMTFWKTVLYFVQDVFSGFSSTSARSSPQNKTLGETIGLSKRKFEEVRFRAVDAGLRASMGVWLFRFIRGQQVLRKNGGIGFTAIIPPCGLNAQLVFPRGIPHCLQNQDLWFDKGAFYHKLNSTVITVPALFPPRMSFVVCDPETINAMNNDRVHFDHPPEINSVATFLYGNNLINTTGALYKKPLIYPHSVMTQKNNKAVWTDVLDLVQTQMYPKMDSMADASGTTHIEDCGEFLAVIALMVIGRSGFGKEVFWPEEDQTDVPFYEAMLAVLDGLIARLALPKLAWKLPIPYLQKMERGSKEFERAILQIIHDRNTGLTGAGEKREGKNDLLTALIEANEEQDASTRLTDAELLGNCFLILLAGYETTSNALTATLIFLTLWPEHQEKIYEEVRTVFGTEPIANAPYTELKYTQACFQESLRMFSPVPVLTKICTKDTFITSRTVPEDGSPGVPSKVFVPKGSVVRQNVHGAHCLNQFWEDPFSFKPERFLDEHDAKSWLPFSSGRRGCIGKSFAHTEGIAILAAIVLRYKIEVPDHLKEKFKALPGETQQARCDRLIKTKFVIAVKPQEINLSFVRR
ncbi:hypothetical protein MNV49_007072 [Pseudohyphozyma bogoriensis]|nr:hypothetical protein MNV49_007072 [Pseudohyphozyma bogoriensis]